MITEHACPEGHTTLETGKSTRPVCPGQGPISPKSHIPDPIGPRKVDGCGSGTEAQVDRDVDLPRPLLWSWF